MNVKAVFALTLGNGGVLAAAILIGVTLRMLVLRQQGKEIWPRRKG